MELKNNMNRFIEYTKLLDGDEKSEAQLFCDRFFRAFGYGGVVEANGKLEARIKFISTGRTKFADCLWSPVGRSGVLIEMKKKSEINLEGHFPQARDYWIEMNPEKAIGPGAQKPEYIILCNFDKFLIYRQLCKVDEITIQELPDRLSAFNFMLMEPKEPIFQHNVEAISSEAARKAGRIFKRLIFDRKEDGTVVRTFLLQCVLASFAEDFGLLPSDIFTELIRDCLNGQSSYDLFGGLFKQMSSSTPAKAGRFKDVEFFNGGLFENVEPVELDDVSLEELHSISNLNWKNINPSIFGALFEGTMNKKDRHKFGAHFTCEADILKIVHPTIIRPWKQRINSADKLSDLLSLLDDLEQYKVLDPACGCGNFLYVAYMALKDIEMQIIEKIAASFSYRTVQSLKLGTSRVSIKQFYGIDVIPEATEVAKVTMMLGKEVAIYEWNKRISPLMSSLGLDFEEGLPLDRLDENIFVDDAIFCVWPKCNVIIGNPPYQSKNKIVSELGREYVDKLRAHYPDIPGRADYCVYWFRKAHDNLLLGQRAGLVGTNTIRQTYSRIGGLDYITHNMGNITDAISTQVWSGAAVVHVSIVNWIKDSNTSAKKNLIFQNGDSIDSPFEYHEVPYINSSLSLAHDVSTAHTLKTYSKPKACYQGQTHGHPGFLLTEDELKNFENQVHIHPYLTGDELLSYQPGAPFRYVIDLNHASNVYEARKEIELFEHLFRNVYPAMKEKAENEEKKLEKNSGPRQSHFKKWWTFWRARHEMICMIEKYHRYIACSRVTKRPVFEFVSSRIHPNDALQVFPMPDDYSFGILQSDIHWDWFSARCSTLKSDPRYTSTTVFHSFPWPQNPSTNDVKLISALAKELHSMRCGIIVSGDLNLRKIYKLEEISPSTPISKIQGALNDAVRNAYGMRKIDDPLAFILTLNEELAQKENEKKNIRGPGHPFLTLSQLQSLQGECIPAPSLRL